FFFQAEGGIRGYKVTGVQTCALQICGVRSDLPDTGADRRLRAAGGGPRDRTVDPLGVPPRADPRGNRGSARGRRQRPGGRGRDRSEERLVGKECGCGGSWERVEE